MRHHKKWVRLTLCILFFSVTQRLPVVVASSIGNDEKPTIVWVLRDMPPGHFMFGPEKGTGFADKALNELISRLPHYNHMMVYAHLKRTWRLLETNDNYCTPSIISTPERLKISVMTTPQSFVPRMGIIFKTKDLPLFSRHINDTSGEINLTTLIYDKQLHGNIEIGREYPKKVKDALALEESKKAIFSYSESKILFSMLQNERVQYTFGYDFEIAYYLQQTSYKTPYTLIDLNKMSPPIPAYIACSKTKTGENIVRDINAVLHKNGKPLFQSYLDDYVNSVPLVNSPNKK